MRRFGVIGFGFDVYCLSPWHSTDYLGIKERHAYRCGTASSKGKGGERGKPAHEAFFERGFGHDTLGGCVLFFFFFGRFPGLSPRPCTRVYLCCLPLFSVLFHLPAASTTWRGGGLSYITDMQTRCLSQTLQTLFESACLPGVSSAASCLPSRGGVVVRVVCAFAQWAMKWRYMI